MTTITEIQFFKNDQYITKTLKGDKIEFIKNRIATRKSKNMILEVNTYNIYDFETINSLKFKGLI